MRSASGSSTFSFLLPSFDMTKSPPPPSPGGSTPLFLDFYCGLPASIFPCWLSCFTQSRHTLHPSGRRMWLHEVPCERKGSLESAVEPLTSHSIIMIVRPSAWIHQSQAASLECHSLSKCHSTARCHIHSSIHRRTHRARLGPEQVGPSYQSVAQAD